MNYLEEVTDKRHHGWFVDLFVKPSNNIAVGFYRKIGYEVYRCLVGWAGVHAIAFSASQALIHTPQATTKHAQQPPTQQVRSHSSWLSKIISLWQHARVFVQMSLGRIEILQDPFRQPSRSCSSTHGCPDAFQAAQWMVHQHGYSLCLTSRG